MKIEQILVKITFNLLHYLKGIKLHQRSTFKVQLKLLKLALKYIMALKAQFLAGAPMFPVFEDK